jgi:hypothetical protein
MRKAKLAAVLFALGTALAFGASVKVLQPNGGEMLTPGQTYQYSPPSGRSVFFGRSLSMNPASTQ